MLTDLFQREVETQCQPFGHSEDVLFDLFDSVGAWSGSPGGRVGCECLSIRASGNKGTAKASLAYEFTCAVLALPGPFSARLELIWPPSLSHNNIHLIEFCLVFSAISSQVTLLPNNLIPKFAKTQRKDFYS
jgi:hypothetical protein